MQVNLFINTFFTSWVKQKKKKKKKLAKLEIINVLKSFSFFVINYLAYYWPLLITNSKIITKQFAKTK